MTRTEHILNLVRTNFGVNDAELRSRRKHRNVAEARLTAGYMLMVDGVEQRKIASLFKKCAKWPSWALYRCPALGEADKRYRAKVQAVYNGMQDMAVAA